MQEPETTEQPAEAAAPKKRLSSRVVRTIQHTVLVAGAMSAGMIAMPGCGPNQQEVERKEAEEDA